MDKLRIAFRALAAIIGIIFRRLTRGPTRPSWSWQTEIARAAQAAALEGVAGMDPIKGRELMEGLLPETAVATGIVRSEHQIAGVRVVREAPDGKAPGEPHILYFHGGGYAFGSPESHAGLTQSIASGTGGTVHSVDYRLAPEHPYPDALDDGLAVYRALLADGISPSQIVLGGDSAGGNLTVSLLLALREAGEAMPAGAVLLCPWVDLTTDADSFRRNAESDMLAKAAADVWARAFAGDRDISDPGISPTHADLRGLPPLLVFGGEAEALVDSIEVFAKKASDAGVEVDLRIYPEMFHDWMILDFIPQAAEAIDEICEFASKRAS